MTIGIAAYGKRAGLAVVEGLRAAEAVGQGALHGFVSLVAFGSDGRLHRAEIQDGGIAALRATGMLTPDLLAATRAGLMSSGPNRPNPLSQFTPADPNVGLVTGHRFPNTPGALGVPLNVAVLERMRQGHLPADALSAIVADNPAADAGFIALTHDGRLELLNTPYLRSFGDAGGCFRQTEDGASGVAVLHNAIRPHQSLAALVCEVALDVMEAPLDDGPLVTLTAGTKLRSGAENAIDIDDDGLVLDVTVSDTRYLSGSWSFGLGYRAIVRHRGQRIGRALYEPYIRAENDIVVTADGAISVTFSVTRI